MQEESSKKNIFLRQHLICPRICTNRPHRLGRTGKEAKMFPEYSLRMNELSFMGESGGPSLTERLPQISFCVNNVGYSEKLLGDLKTLQFS